MLATALEGNIDAFQHILDVAYGRKGGLRWDIMKVGIFGAGAVFYAEHTVIAYFVGSQRPPPCANHCRQREIATTRVFPRADRAAHLDALPHHKTVRKGSFSISARAAKTRRLFLGRSAAPGTAE